MTAMPEIAVPDMNVSHVDLDVVHDALHQLLHEPFLQSKSVWPCKKKKQLSHTPFDQRNKYNIRELL